MARSIDDVSRNYRYFARQYSLGRNEAADERRISQATRRHRAGVARTQNVCARAITAVRRCHVDNADVPQYVAYAQKLHRARRLFTCLTLANEVRVLTACWAGRGLDPAVLADVCREVLGFGPGRPGERPCEGCDRRRGCKLAAQ